MPLDGTTDDPKRARQLDDLARLRALGMGMAEEVAGLNTRVVSEETAEAVEACGVLSLAFSRVSRSVRQIVALEEEAMGLREMRKARERRNADTAEALRLRLGGLVRERVPGIDKGYLDGLLSDLFRDYDDYDDYEAGDIGPVLARIRTQLSQDREAEAWPAPAAEDPYSTLDDEEFERRIMEQLDEVARRKAEYEAQSEAERKADAVRRWRGHDPP